MVTAITEGKATITVRTMEGGLTATCEVTVNKIFLGILPEGDASCIYYYGDILSVNTPRQEHIAVYSLTGSLIYLAQKAAGEANSHIPNIPKGILLLSLKLNIAFLNAKI
jgi:hypothetical protein